jgi:hypothetical protein
MITKTRTTLVALAASLSLASAALAPAASEALPVQGAGGGFACYHEGKEYKDGESITVNGRTWRCENGIWSTSSYLVGLSQPSGGPVLGRLAIE